MEKKIECEIVEDLLFGYVDDTLNKESKKLVEEHLIKCENCQERLKEIREDIGKNEKNMQKEIDYLKKVRIKSRIRSVIMAIAIIFIIVFIMYFNKFVKINSIYSKANKSLQSENYYVEECTNLDNRETVVNRLYYKNGKYKMTSDVYSEDGIEHMTTTYGTVDSDETIEVNERAKIVNVLKGDIAKAHNQKEELKYYGQLMNKDESVIGRIGKVFAMTIDTDNYGSNKEYYVLKYKNEKKHGNEIFIDKENGLVIKRFQTEAEKRFFTGTDIVKEINDRTTTYKYKFDIVKDEDVKVPEFTGYTIQNKSYNFSDFK